MSDEQKTADAQFLPFVKANDYKNIFANFLRMKVSPSEFTIYFGIMEEVQQGVNVGLESVGVIMTPAVAKSLAEVLSQTVSVFENQHGEIKQPSSKPLDAEKMAEIVNKQKEKIEGKR